MLNCRLYKMDEIEIEKEKKKSTKKTHTTFDMSINFYLAFPLFSFASTKATSPLGITWVTQ